MIVWLLTQSRLSLGLRANRLWFDHLRLGRSGLLFNLGWLGLGSLLLLWLQALNVFFLYLWLLTLYVIFLYLWLLDLYVLFLLLRLLTLYVLLSCLLIDIKNIEDLFLDDCLVPLIVVFMSNKLFWDLLRFILVSEVIKLHNNVVDLYLHWDSRWTLLLLRDLLHLFDVVLDGLDLLWMANILR